ncbi:hypothetical protein F511_41251 [Dorcoceras hygrometricum]|uniref:Uncharacterized protein n=1 Tax=Dorcoceras hygrometricum TaxID=472368 RepID=A0A2Z7B861_9LAMI|nr:hypothetical protein F511_41251 [Dorcoceras hygrometricum]
MASKGLMFLGLLLAVMMIISSSKVSISARADPATRATLKWMDGMEGATTTRGAATTLRATTRAAATMKKNQEKETDIFTNPSQRSAGTGLTVRQFLPDVVIHNFLMNKVDVGPDS